MQPTRLSILGVGLLGGSVGLAVKSILNDCYVVGYGHRDATLTAACEMGAIDEGTTDVSAAVRGSDLVLLCTPVGIFDQLLEQIAPALAPGSIVSDVGSTKRSIVRDAERILPKHVHFVGSHPMAGSEKRGVEFARTDLFHKALCLVTPTSHTDPVALEKVESFWKMLGMRIKRLSPHDHDEMLAEVSHLPHALASLLMRIPSNEALDLCGKGFMDATRIAGGDGALWRDIFIDNRDNMITALDNLQTEVSDLKACLMGLKSLDLAQWLNDAAKRREQLARKKLTELGNE